MSENQTNNDIKVITPNNSINLEKVQNHNNSEFLPSLSITNQQQHNESNNVDNSEDIYNINAEKTKLIFMIENYSARRYKDRILAKYPEIFDDLLLLDEKQLQNRLNTLKNFIKFKTTNKSVEFT